MRIVVHDDAGRELEEDAAWYEHREAELTFYRGISVAHPRVARRAFAKGDKARAREFAQQVVDAWSVADVKLPVVDEMRAILDKTK